MRKMLPCFLLALSFYANSQTVTFKDGTTVDVNSADMSYENIRRASLGVSFFADGHAGSKFIYGSFLQPEKFLIVGNGGFNGLSMEGTYFFSGRTKEKRKSFSLKQTGGYHSTTVYSLRTTVQKRKEIGAYLSINDLGHIISAPKADGDQVDFYDYGKLTTIFAGISTVNYWQADMNIEDDVQKRGQYTGRVVLAPFICTGGEVNKWDVDKTGEGNIPQYGVRLFYELSNSFGFAGARVRGRTNILLRLGGDYFQTKENGYDYKIIAGMGLCYNFL